MVGLVLVSHSAELAEGIAVLAREMGGQDCRDRHRRRAGRRRRDRHRRDAGRRRDRAVWSEDGVLVVMDLGSAVLSAEMGLDSLDPERRARVVLSDAPFVEGAVAAAVAAKLGRPLEEVEREARGGLAGKAAHLGSEVPSLEPVGTEGAPSPPANGGPEVRVTLKWTSPTDSTRDRRQGSCRPRARSMPTFASRTSRRAADRSARGASTPSRRSESRRDSGSRSWPAVPRPRSSSTRCVRSPTGGSTRSPMTGSPGPGPPRGWSRAR